MKERKPVGYKKINDLGQKYRETITGEVLLVTASWFLWKKKTGRLGIFQKGNIIKLLLSNLVNYYQGILLNSIFIGQWIGSIVC